MVPSVTDRMGVSGLPLTPILTPLWGVPMARDGQWMVAPPPPLWTVILDPQMALSDPPPGGPKLPFLGPCGAQSGGGGGAPPTTLILLRNQ